MAGREAAPEIFGGAGRRTAGKDHKGMEQQRKTAAFTYRLVRSKRKTMSLHVKEDGTITVRAPYGLASGYADAFVDGHRDWILSRLAGYERLRQQKPDYTEEERQAGRRKAQKVLEERCRFYGGRMGVSYGRITVREQKTRWGSCSAKGNLSFNWKLVLMPEEILDYLVVHELAHRKEMNHSPAFWKVVEREIPDYKTRRAWLKQNGMKY